MCTLVVEDTDSQIKTEKSLVVKRIENQLNKMYSMYCKATINLCYFINRFHSYLMTQFQIKGGGLVQGVTKLITTFSA